MVDILVDLSGKRKDWIRSWYYLEYDAISGQELDEKEKEVIYLVVVVVVVVVVRK
jgi:hypothetical protein